MQGTLPGRLGNGTSKAIFAALIAIVVLVSIPVLLGSAVLGGTKDFVSCQCDSVVGPDPSVTVRQSAASKSSPCMKPVRTSGIPATNPYAGLATASGPPVSGWLHACVAAMEYAPFQLAPLRTSATGIGVECAGRHALAFAGHEYRSVATESAAAMTRAVVHLASTAVLTGHCANADIAEIPDAGVGLPVDARDERCDRRTYGMTDSVDQVVILPRTIAAQGLCGQRVDSSAVSAGDLVFWSYRDGAPTRVGIAVDDERMVTLEDSAGRFVVAVLPERNDVRVKRVLAEAG
ncbi:hypothetical protein [Nocardia sp. NPDC051832]|uniref:hypothetical protein n=1 Tax=Nocardia sp. NPDC051832 TaxID=3155673 RepID=UPI00341F9921